MVYEMYVNGALVLYKVRFFEKKQKIKQIAVTVTFVTVVPHFALAEMADEFYKLKWHSSSGNKHAP
jgi:hypothetical protein